MRLVSSGSSIQIHPSSHLIQVSSTYRSEQRTTTTTQLNYSSTIPSNPPTSASVVHWVCPPLLLHFCPRVCWSPFSIWPSRRSLKGRPLDRHSNHSSSPIVGLLRSFSLSLGYCIHLLRVLLLSSGLHCPSLIRSPQFTAFIHLSYFNCCLFSVFLLAYYYERPSMGTRGRKGDPSSSLWDYVV